MSGSAVRIRQVALNSFTMEQWDNETWQGKSEERVVTAYKVAFYSIVMMVAGSIIVAIFS